MLQLRWEIAQVSLVGYLVLVAAFLQQIIAARLLGPEQFGRFAAVAAITGLLEIALVGRSSDLAMRYLGTTNRERTGLGVGNLRRSLLVSDMKAMLPGYVLLLALVGMGGLFTNIDWALFAILGLTIPTQIGYGANKCSLLMLSSVKPLGNFELVYTVLATILNVLGILLGGVYGYAASLAVASLLKNLLAYAFLKSEWVRSPAEKVIEELRTGHVAAEESTHLALGRDGMVAVVRNLMVNGLSQADIIILSLFMPGTAVGHYRVGKSLASLTTKVAFPLWRFLNPRIMTGLRTGRTELVRSAIAAGSLVLIPISTCIIGFAAIWGERVITALYGLEFRPAYFGFVILLFGASVLNGFGGWLSIWTVHSGAQRFGICVYAAALAAQIVFGLTIGSRGAVHMAFVTSLCMCSVYASFYVKAVRA